MRITFTFLCSTEGKKQPVELHTATRVYADMPPKNQKCLHEDLLVDSWILLDWSVKVHNWRNLLDVNSNIDRDWQQIQTWSWKQGYQSTSNLFRIGTVQASPHCWEQTGKTLCNSSSHKSPASPPWPSPRTENRSNGLTFSDRVALDHLRDTLAENIRKLRQKSQEKAWKASLSQNIPKNIPKNIPQHCWKIQDWSVPMHSVPRHMASPRSTFSWSVDIPWVSPALGEIGIQHHPAIFVGAMPHAMPETILGGLCGTILVDCSSRAVAMQKPSVDSLTRSSTGRQVPLKCKVRGNNVRRDSQAPCLGWA